MRRLGIVLVIAVSLGACSNGGEDVEAEDSFEEYTTTAPPPGRSFAEWQAATRAVCAEYEPRAVALVQSLPAPDGPESLVAYIDAVLPLNDEYLTALRAIPIPTERTRSVERLHDRLDRIEQDALSIRAAAERVDHTAAIAAVDRLRASGMETNAMASELGLPECVTPASAA